MEHNNMRGGTPRNRRDEATFASADETIIRPGDPNYIVAPLGIGSEFAVICNAVHLGQEWINGVASGHCTNARTHVTTIQSSTLGAGVKN